MDTEENRMQERDDEISKIIRIVELIIEELGKLKCSQVRSDVAANIIDLDLSDEISGFLMTIFTCLRKEENDKPGYQRFLAYTATVDAVEVSVRSIVEKVKAEKIELNFLICTPIVELMTLFRAFFDEVRTGVTRFRVRESVAKRGLKRDKDGRNIQNQKRQENTQYDRISHSTV